MGASMKNPVLIGSPGRVAVLAGLVGGISLLWPDLAFGQAAPEDFLGIYESATEALKNDALAVARALFLSLAVLEAIVTASGISVDEQLGIDSIFRRLAMKAVVLGAIYLLLLRPEIAIDPMLGGMESVGAFIAGQPAMTPKAIMLRGLTFSNSIGTLWKFEVVADGWGITYVGVILAAIVGQAFVLVIPKLSDSRL